jgi:hypothetical protein
MRKGEALGEAGAGVTAVEDLGAETEPMQPARQATARGRIMVQRIPTSIENRLAFVTLAKQGWLKAAENTLPRELAWIVLECRVMIG